MPEVALELRSAPLSALPDYNFSSSEYPCINLNITIPDGDLPVLKNWLSSKETTLSGLSETALNRMSNSVKGAMRSYCSYADRRGILTRPLKVGFAFRNSSGSYTHIDTSIIAYDYYAPDMCIEALEWSNNVFRTQTAIKSVPCLLNLNIKPFDPEDYGIDEEGTFDVIATEQVDISSRCGPVTGLKREDGDVYWDYYKPDAETIEYNAKELSNFRILKSFPVSQVRDGMDLQNVLQGMNLSEDTFMQLPEYEGPITKKTELSTHATGYDGMEFELEWQYYYCGKSIHGGAGDLKNTTSRNWHTFGVKKNAGIPKISGCRRLYRCRAVLKDGEKSEWIYFWIDAKRMHAYAIT